jgi:hypothetical protein
MATAHQSASAFFSVYFFIFLWFSLSGCGFWFFVWFFLGFLGSVLLDAFQTFCSNLKVIQVLKLFKI